MYLGVRFRYRYFSLLRAGRGRAIDRDRDMYSAGRRCYSSCWPLNVLDDCTVHALLLSSSELSSCSPQESCSHFEVLGRMSSRSARVDYRKLHRASTADVLPPPKRRKRLEVSDGCFEVSHVLAKRKAGRVSEQFRSSSGRQQGTFQVVSVFVRSEY